MKKRMMEVIVKTDPDGSIRIIQPDFGPDEDGDVIVLSPAQVPTLVTWLQEAQKELEAAGDPEERDDR